MNGYRPAEKDYAKCLRVLRQIYLVYDAVPRAGRIRRGVADVGKAIKCRGQGNLFKALAKAERAEDE